MSYTNTTRLGLAKANPGTNQPFETAVINSNWDKVEAEAVATDVRLDLVEANNWVTTAKIANLNVTSDKLAANSVVAGKIAPNAISSNELQNGAVQNSKLAGGLDAGKIAFGTLNPTLLPAYGINVGQLTSTLDFSGNTVNVATQAAGTVNTLAASTAFVVARIAEKSLPTLIRAGVLSGTTGGGGDIVQSFTGLGFSGTPIVTGTLNPAAAGASGNLVVTVSSTSAGSVVFRIYDAAGNVASSESVTVNWIAVQS